MRRLRDACVQNNVNIATVILTEEKSSVTLVDRLDDFVIKASCAFIVLMQRAHNVT